jgi:hypothetical protein
VPATFVVALIGLGAAITADVVPGVFSVDDNNYLINVVALRHGRVTVPQTDGLPPSAELLFFDPGPWTRTVTSTPVASTAPPLYAPIALPFSFGGWRGLVALNTAAYLLTSLMVFAYTRQHATRELTPWLAAAAFALAGFSIEYAEGVWPHMLSVGLCTAGILLGARAAGQGGVRDAALAGAALGIAAGVRYQNVILLAGLGAGLLVFAWRRWLAIAAFAAGAAVPLAASSAINYARLGSLNPISKGPGYMTLAVGAHASEAWWDPLVMLWAKVVDFSARPPITGAGTEGWLHYEPATGAHLMLADTLQKAFVQSAPWALVGFLVLAAAWIAPRYFDATTSRQLRFMSMPVAALLAVMSLTSGRHEGYTFNQRYLLELVPLTAIAFALALDRVAWRPPLVAVGAVAGALIVMAILTLTPPVGTAADGLWLLRHVLLFKTPIALGAMLVAGWLLAARFRHGPLAAAVAIGLCLGWGFTLHYADDVRASHRSRRYNAQRTARLAPVVQDGMVIVTYWYGDDAAVPLLLERDFLMLDTRADEGRDAPALVRELLGRRRRVLLLGEGFPAPVLARVVNGLEKKRLPAPGLDLYELSAAQ